MTEINTDFAMHAVWVSRQVLPRAADVSWIVNQDGTLLSASHENIQAEWLIDDDDDETLIELAEEAWEKAIDSYRAEGARSLRDREQLRSQNTSF
jgi:hypothetical protein